MVGNPMRRSKNVVAPLLASAAVSLLAACRTTEMQRCVDATNHVSDPLYCQQGQGHGSTGYFGGGGGYHYVYGGSGNYAPGSVVTDASPTPVSGHSYSTTNGTARGGFGGSFGGGSGEGGAGE
jgi:hypothetical protein